MENDDHFNGSKLHKPSEKKSRKTLHNLYFKLLNELFDVKQRFTFGQAIRINHLPIMFK